MNTIVSGSFSSLGRNMLPPNGPVGHKILSYSKALTTFLYSYPQWSDNSSPYISKPVAITIAPTFNFIS
ncbi:hypothetical protein ES703_72457 [subsurface metagenome]